MSITPGDLTSASEQLERVIDKQTFEINRIGMILWVIMGILLLASTGAWVAVDWYIDRWEPVEVDPQARTIDGEWSFWNDTITVSLNVTDAEGTINWTDASGYAISDMTGEIAILPTPLDRSQHDEAEVRRFEIAGHDLNPPCSWRIFN